MKFFKLILRNLSFYRKSYIAILFGTILSTAVLTGALIVGDSVRYSLKHVAELRLGKTHFAVQSGDRFFRMQMAKELTVALKTQTAPVLQLEGIAINSDKDLRLNRVQINGIDSSFFSLWNASIMQPKDDEAIISNNTAQKLNLKTGDEFVLKIQKATVAPQNAPFVSDKSNVVSLRLKVAMIADDKSFGRFSLKSNQTAPYNIFIPIDKMAKLLELNDYANLILIAENTNEEAINQAIEKVWKTTDAGIKIRKSDNKCEITSQRIFVDDNVSDAMLKILPTTNESILTYFVNEISANQKTSPYSFVTAANTSLLADSLQDNEIIINQWLADDLSVKSGDSLWLKYFIFGSLRTLKEDSCQFKIKKIVPIENQWNDKDLMPAFPGMTVAGNCGDWETGVPINLKKIREKDETYWKQHKGTPKAFISISKGQKLWRNKFGQYTAFRFQVDNENIASFETNLLQQLKPSQTGLTVLPVSAESTKAVENSTDFGQLFLSLSFFIILAGILLTAMLFSLQISTRLSETGVLTTLGFRKHQIIKILLGEVALVSAIGGMIGAFVGIIYNYLIVLGLNSVWTDAVQTQMLEVHVNPQTLFVGAISSISVVLLVLYFVLYRNLKKTASFLIKESEIQSFSRLGKKRKISMAITLGSLLISLFTVIYLLANKQVENAELFLTVGFLVLVCGSAAMYWLTFQKFETFGKFNSLALKNLGLKRNRSISAIVLLALGTYTVIITGANHKTFNGTESDRKSGTGGFLFWAECSIPILNNLNTSEGKKQYNLEDETELAKANFVQLLRLDGNDASCLNLNQVAKPVILGVNANVFNQLNAFTFVNIDKSVDKNNVWNALKKSDKQDVIPAFADQTVITWGLRKSLGDTLEYLDEAGNKLKIRLIGALDNSVFQGHILISDSIFLKHFPSVSGSKIMLIDAQYANREAIASSLENLFRDYGMVVTLASQRLASFNAVENTYLSVFMALGGLGVLIGTLGLGIVLLRNVQERKSELALYIALGYSKKYIFRLLLTEYSLILVAGIVIGFVSAFTGILPSVLSPAFHIPSLFVFFIVAVIFVNGFLWIYFPARNAAKSNIISALRKE